MKKSIVWKQDGWTVVQEADAKKHILEITCRAANGTVEEVRVRHNDGEEKKGVVTKDGANALPMSLDDFKKDYLAGNLDIR